jgi:hypothetical protein
MLNKSTFETGSSFFDLFYNPNVSNHCFLLKIQTDWNDTSYVNISLNKKEFHGLSNFFNKFLDSNKKQIKIKTIKRDPSRIKKQISLRRKNEKNS